MMIQYGEYYKRSSLKKTENPDLVFNEKLRFRKIERHVVVSGLILDVGCGAGDLQKYTCLAPQRLVGVDLNHARLKEAEHRLKVVASVDHLPFRAGIFHTVIASEVVEHISQPQEFVKEARRVSQATGQLIVSVPYREQPTPVECPHCLQIFFLNGHINYFDRKALQNLLAMFNSSNRFFVVNNILTRYLNRHLRLPFFLSSALDVVFSKFFTRSSKYLIGVA